MSEAKNGTPKDVPDTFEPLELVLEKYKEQIARVRAALDGKADDSVRTNLMIYRYLKGERA